MSHHHSWQETLLGQGPPKMKVANYWHHRHHKTLMTNPHS